MLVYHSVIDTFQFDELAKDARFVCLFLFHIIVKVSF